MPLAPGRDRQLGLVRPRPTRLLMALIATTTQTSACQGSGIPSATSTPTSTVGTTTSTSVPTSDAPPPTRSVDWFDLDVGDCLADPPPVDDPNVIAVTLVDCATPHRAEVFPREPLAVYTAIADVASRKCDDGFTAYTGEPVGSARPPLTATPTLRVRAARRAGTSRGGGASRRRSCAGRPPCQRSCR